MAEPGPAERTLEAVEAELAALRTRLDTDARKRLAELEVARRIQVSLMPAVAPRMGPWEMAVLYRPARTIGGDFYDLYELPGRPGVIGATVADVTGKGLTAALLMGFARAILRSAAYNASDAEDALRRANGVFARDVRTGLFLSAWSAWLHPDGSIRGASAGHEPAFVWRARSGRIDSTGGGGSMLGLFDRPDVTARTVRLGPGDVLLAFTDGATDARARDGRRFGDRRLRAAFGASAPGGAAAAIAGIDAAIGGFCPDADDPADDLTMLAIGRPA